ncbi:MAG: hypothetical protein AB7N76_33735 [Planctomycetota bacterium]
MSRDGPGLLPRIALALLVAVLAVLPRLEPALRDFHHSPDAAENLLIARSLRAGEGFVLPIRVRFQAADVQAPAVHEAYGERAPLYPWLLAPLVRPEPGWPPAALQLSGVALAALAAVLAASLGGELARRRGLRGAPLVMCSLLGGLTVAWLPFLVRASVHLWAEPLGLVLVLAALRLAWQGELDPAGRGTLLGEALCAGLARFARPEAWVLVPLLVLWHWAGGRRRRALALLALLAALNAALCAATGVLAPQLDLLRAARYEDLMDPARSAPPAGLAQILAGIARNLAHQLEAALLPKNAFLVLPLALLSLRAPAGRLLALAAAGLAAATIVVWSTDDPTRFTIAPLSALAPLAAVELLVRWRRHAPTQRWLLAALLGAWLAVLGHAAGRSMRGRTREPECPTQALPGEPHLADPWTYALVTGRPAVLAAPPGR